jgi:hypothetical protein
MQYTLWSRGRLLGETDLGFIYRENGFRIGWFHPNAVGDRLMPAATGVAPAMRYAHDIGPDATARADVLAALDQESALELELRHDGIVIATENIAIVDTHYLLSIPSSIGEEALTPDELASIGLDLEEWTAAHEADPPWKEPAETTEWPRYQIQIRLVDHYAIP